MRPGTSGSTAIYSLWIPSVIGATARHIIASPLPLVANDSVRRAQSLSSFFSVFTRAPSDTKDHYIDTQAHYPNSNILSTVTMRTFDAPCSRGLTIGTPTVTRNALMSDIHSRAVTPPAISLSVHVDLQCFDRVYRPFHEMEEAGEQYREHGPVEWDAMGL